jgi:NADP-dependent 3-hydroxy acid dehydrogenase YdfG
MATAVITGGTQGIGKAVAEKFLSEGFSVSICARNEKDLAQTESEWKDKFPGSRILVVKADLADKSQVAGFAAETIKSLDTVDVLVNNAGLFFPGKLQNEQDGHLEELMKVNVYSAYYLTRHLIPSLKKSKKGHIFNMCSIASLRAYENGGSYSITKYALLGFSENLRDELMEDDIRVTAVMPGATWSRSWQSTGLPEKRFMQPGDIADLIWSAYTLTSASNVDSIVIRPIRGDI